MPESPSSRRLLVLLVCSGVWILLLMVRLVDLQVVRRTDFQERARMQQERTIELPPRRGAISDRNGKSLAVTSPVDSVFAIPSDIRKPEETARVLSEILSIPLKETRRKLSDSGRDFVWIARRIDESLAQKVAARHLEGVRLLKEATRSYPQGTLASSVLGYVGLDNQGLSGLEYRYDRIVRGRPAKVTVLRDAAQRLYASPGRPLPHDRREGRDVEGSSLVLTLDSAIQHVAEREMLKVLETYRARGASAVVMDPSNGEILALASAPDFDPNRYSEFDIEHRRCRPVADVYEPGSTFKAFTVAAAMEAGLLDENDIVDCGGGTLTIGSKTIHEHGRSRWASLPVIDVLAYSSNIGSAKIGLSIGKADFYRSLRTYGFGQRTGIELEGETAGLLRDVHTWSALSLPTISFGQGIGVTILQMVRGYSVIANGGWLHTPRLLAEVRRPDGRVESPRHEPARRVMSEKTAQSMRRLLESVVVKGTGKHAAVSGFSVAGKTGTAQKAAPGGGYSPDKHVASFIGMVPADNPRVVIAVVVDEPKGKMYGGDVAAPAFAAIAAETLKILQEPARPQPDSVTPTVLLADLSAARSRSAPAAIPGLVSAAYHFGDSQEVIVSGIPDVMSQSARDAVRLLSEKGVRVRLSGRGFVVSQTPAPGTPIDSGSVCDLVLSLTPVPPPPVPGVTAVLASNREGVR